MIPAPPTIPSPENPGLRAFKAIVFAFGGVVMMAVAIYSTVSTRAFVARAHRASGEVTRLNAGGSHPEVRFTTDDGQTVEYPQNGMIGGYRPGDHVTVLYDPLAPTMDPTVDTAGALWGFTAMDGLMGVVFVLAARLIWREGRAALTPPPLPGR